MFNVSKTVRAYLALQAPALVAHFTRYAPLGSDRLVKFLATLVVDLLPHGRPVAVTFVLGTARLITAPGTVFLLQNHLTSVGRLSWLKRVRRLSLTIEFRCFDIRPVIKTK